MTDVRFRSDVVVDLVDFLGGDERVVQAARVSTKGEASRGAQSGVQGLIRYLMREGHHVPFEHSVFTFYIEAPIFVTRQLLKHRISSISETSGRYRELEGDFYVPAEDRPLVQVGKTGDYVFEPGDERHHHVAATAVTTVSRAAWYAYNAMLQEGISKEVARMVLPVNLYSSMYLTLNARSLMNVLDLRTSDKGSHPQHEIELVGKAIEGHFEAQMPLTYAAYKEEL